MAAFLPLLLLAVAANAALMVTLPGLNQDGLYLLDAKRALTASALADWNPRDATPCGWTGVSCVDGAVTEVSLPNANLTGSFPAALCLLPRLQSLNLRENYIGPDIAKAVAGCKALVRLDLYMNTLVGPLPDALAELPELVYLSLEANNFSGPIPDSFGTFKKLQSLSLVNNLLGGEVPAFLGRISTLRELNMSYNPFAPGPVPAELGDLTSCACSGSPAATSSAPSRRLSAGSPTSPTSTCR
ncbi:hypothetical protein ZWY2020_033492 [Hordeum vulgare]|nr:hypothetical protein ZWY2020_033492 [Hordeum vulgare]